MNSTNAQSQAAHLSQLRTCGNGDGTDAVRALYGSHAPNYTQYANGSIDAPFAFLGEGNHAFAHGDGTVWRQIKKLLQECSARIKPGEPLRILDAGCGDGMWAIRIADYLSGLGKSYEILGLDLTPEMLVNARGNLDRYEQQLEEKTYVRFQEGDLSRPLDFPSAHFDVTMSLFTVLNHIPRERRDSSVRELLRVTRQRHFSVVKGAAGQPTAYVCSLEETLGTQSTRDGLKITGLDGTTESLPVNVPTAFQWRQIFRRAGGEVLDYVGVDLFVSRFLNSPTASPQPPPGLDSVAREAFVGFDERYGRDPRIIDFANHVAFLVRPL